MVTWQKIANVRGPAGKSPSVSEIVDEVLARMAATKEIVPRTAIKNFPSARDIMIEYSKLSRKDKISWQQMFREDGNPFQYYQVNGSGNSGNSGNSQYIVVNKDTHNTGLGYNIFSSTITGVMDTAVGESALQNATTASYSSAFGYQALMNNIDGLYNDAFGEGSQVSSTSGSFNSSFGEESLYSNLGGSRNATVGVNTLFFCTNANNNVAVGTYAGEGAGSYSMTGSTFVGVSSGQGVTDGADYNTFIGYGSGRGITSGTKNTIIGGNAADTSLGATLSNNVIITDGDGTVRLQIDENGVMLTPTIIQSYVSPDIAIAADAVDWTKSNYQVKSLRGNITMTFTEPIGSAGLTLRLVQDVAGSRTVAWPAAVKWSGGVAPTLSTAGNSVDIITFRYDKVTGFYYGLPAFNFA